MATKSIFVSHSHQDNEWCRPFADALKAVGYEVWYDEVGLQGGAEWIHTLEHEIETRDVFVVVFTPDAMNSSWVRREVDLALAAHRIILPVHITSVRPEGFLRTVHWIEAIGKDSLTVARLVIAALEAGSALPPAAVSPQSPPAKSADTLVIEANMLLTKRAFDQAMANVDQALAEDDQNITAWEIKSKIFHGQLLFDASYRIDAHIKKLKASNQ